MTRRLTPSEPRAVCDPATLPFRSTAELPPVDGLIGQERAATATAFGVGMRHAGYNLFVLGPARTGKTSSMKRVLARAADVLRNPLVRDALKKALKTRSIRIEDPLEEWRLASSAGLAPQPIPLSVKAVLIGSPILYYLLSALDEDFHELFKVKVDFDDSLPRTPEFEMLYAVPESAAVRP
jgi:hypothetical protein